MAKKDGQDARRHRVETRLSDEELERFKHLMAMSHCHSQAEFVRRCVLADEVGWWRAFSRQFAALHATLNRIAVELGQQDEMGGASDTSVARLVRDARSLLARIARARPERRTS